MNPNLPTDRPTFVTHLECSMTGERYEADQLHGLSRVGRPLQVRYDQGQKRGVEPRREKAGRARGAPPALVCSPTPSPSPPPPPPLLSPPPAPPSGAAPVTPFFLSWLFPT